MQQNLYVMEKNWCQNWIQLAKKDRKQSYSSIAYFKKISVLQCYSMKTNSLKIKTNIFSRYKIRQTSTYNTRKITTTLLITKLLGRQQYKNDTWLYQLHRFSEFWSLELGQKFFSPFFSNLLALWCHSMSSILKDKEIRH